MASTPTPRTGGPTMSNETQQPYIPALGFDWLTRFYDPVLRATLREDKFKRLLVEQARLQRGQDVLDLGCGTATLTIMLKQSCPGARIIGLDGDPKVLAVAREKVAAAGADVELHEGMAFAPPFAPGSFDRVVSSLVLHHLTTENKRRTFAQVVRCFAQAVNCTSRIGESRTTRSCGSPRSVSGGWMVPKRRRTISTDAWSG